MRDIAEYYSTRTITDSFGIPPGAIFVMSNWLIACAIFIREPIDNPLIFLAMSRAAPNPLINHATSSGCVPEPRAIRRRQQSARAPRRARSRAVRR